MPMDWRAVNKGDGRGGKPDTGGWAVHGSAGSSQDPEEPMEPTEHTEQGKQHQGLRFLQAPSAASLRKDWRALRNEETGEHRDHPGQGHGAQTRAAGV